MANTGFLATSELDFDTFKSNLKNYLSKQTQFTDYNFDGSNINVLLDLLSYNTYQNAFYLNMIGSEMFLDTAQLRESVVSHAKELNYIPRSRTSAHATIDISIGETAGGVTQNYFATIPKYYPFATTVNGKTYTFVTDAEILAYAYTNPDTFVTSFYASNVVIYEGKIVTQYVTANVVDPTTTNIALSSDNIDVDSIEVLVYPNGISGTSYQYSRATNLFGLGPTSNVYFIQGYAANKYQIIFGDGTFGRALETNVVVQINYRDTSGDYCNGAYTFSKTGNILRNDGTVLNDVKVYLKTIASGGSERENVASIKFNAPRFFTTQDRSVTATDYINLTKQKFPQLQSVIAYGGEEVSPPQYGKVAISAKPYGNAGLISQSLKDEIVSYLRTKNLTIRPFFVDPEYFYTKIDTTVYYNPDATTTGASQISTNVSAAILNYANTYLSEFGDDLRYSKLISTIDATDSSIISNDTTVKMIYRWSPKTGSTQTLSFSYDNELQHQANLHAYYNDQDQVFVSSVFTYYYPVEKTNYSSFFGDDGLGNIFIYTNKKVANVVTRTALGDLVGSIDYTTGTVALSANVYSYSGSSISLYATLMTPDIYTTKNKFLLVNSSDINITMVSSK